MFENLPEFRKKYCLVLGGGGTKGCYEIGVWKALRELHVPIEAVVGTSIGALNGVWVAQNDFEKAEEVWDNLTLDKILHIPSDFKSPDLGNSPVINTFSVLGKVLFETGKLDNKPLRHLVEAQINPEKLAKSKMDLGIVSFNTSRLGPTEVFANEHTTEELADYLMASATFPGFKGTRIKGESFLDGGLYDNLPFETARKRGYRRLILVDVSGIGHYRGVNPQGTETIYIKNSLEFGHVLDFRPEFIQRFKLLGYLDTMKIFGRLTGNSYFLRRDPGFFSHWNKILAKPEFLEEVKYLLPQNHPQGNPLDILRATLPQESRLHKNPAHIFLECAALALNVDRFQVYHPRQLTEKTVIKYWDHMERIQTLDLTPYKNFTTGLLEEWRQPLLSRSVKEKSPLELDLILSRLEFPRYHPKIYGAVTRHFPFLLPAKIFFHMVAWSQKHRLLLPMKSRRFTLADLEDLA